MWLRVRHKPAGFRLASATSDIETQFSNVKVAQVPKDYETGGNGGGAPAVVGVGDLVVAVNGKITREVL